MTTPKHRGHYRPFTRGKAPGRRVREPSNRQCFEIRIRPPESAPLKDSVSDSGITDQDRDA
jgi:hypothetical protein